MKLLEPAATSYVEDAADDNANSVLPVCRKIGCILGQPLPGQGSSIEAVMVETASWYLILRIVVPPAT
jgi:hypothetical protein